jgi:hypothetical protein
VNSAIGSLGRSLEARRASVIHAPSVVSRSQRHAHPVFIHAIILAAHQGPLMGAALAAPPPSPALHERVRTIAARPRCSIAASGESGASSRYPKRANHRRRSLPLQMDNGDNREVFTGYRALSTTSRIRAGQRAAVHSYHPGVITSDTRSPAARLGRMHVEVRGRVRTHVPCQAGGIGQGASCESRARMSRQRSYEARHTRRIRRWKSSTPHRAGRQGRAGAR